MMVLLDTSGSMTLPVNGSLADCRVQQSGQHAAARSLWRAGQPVNCDVNTCPTRWSELRGAMATFLTHQRQHRPHGADDLPGRLDGPTARSACLERGAHRHPAGR